MSLQGNDATMQYNTTRLTEMNKADGVIPNVGGGLKQLECSPISGESEDWYKMAGNLFDSIC